MRIHELVPLLLLASFVPASRAAGQTCQGLSSFQDGKARVSAEYRHSDDYDLYREAAAYGVHDSWYASAGADQRQISRGGGSTAGVSGSIGYQIHVVTTPFQVCPEFIGQYQSGGGANSTSFGAGASLGYRLFIADNFNLIPAAGIHWMSTNVSGGGASTTSSEVFMALGFVLHKTLTLFPTVRVPSATTAKDIMGIGVSWNWSK